MGLKTVLCVLTDAETAPLSPRLQNDGLCLNLPAGGEGLGVRGVTLGPATATLTPDPSPSANDVVAKITSSEAGGEGSRRDIVGEKMRESQNPAINAVAALYDHLAGLLAYPNDTYLRQLSECRRALGECFPEATQRLSHFAERVQGMTTEELQEAYTQTFDLNPVCSLEVGWHLFGENYSRGEFLAEMRGRLRRMGVPESTELPDHLTHVLRVLGRMSPSEANRFSAEFVLPSLDKMFEGLRGRDCLHDDVLEAIRAVVLSPYGAALEEAHHG